MIATFLITSPPPGLPVSLERLAPLGQPALPDLLASPVLLGLLDRLERLVLPARLAPLDRPVPLGLPVSLEQPALLGLLDQPAPPERFI